MFGRMKHGVRIVALRLGALAACVLFAASVHAAPALVDGGPKDMHREVRQVTMRFSDEMVALGDDKAADAAEASEFRRNGQRKLSRILSIRLAGRMEGGVCRALEQCRHVCLPGNAY